MTDTTTGEKKVLHRNGYVSMLNLCHKYVLLLCRYSRENKLPPLSSQKLIETLVRDNVLQYREFRMEIQKVEFERKRVR